MDTAAKGEFSLDAAPPDKDLVMVSTGTGIAPFVSMLRSYGGQHRWRRFVLINGTRHARDLGYRGEMEAITRADPTVVYIPLVTRDPQDGSWSGLRGRVQTALEPDTYQRLVGTPLDPAQCHIFLCGNPDMIDNVERVLADRGFVADSHQGRGNLHFERYW
jgi:ferredoxin--NADP+ reductase